MKKKIFLILLFLILPIIGKAETFKVGDITYSIDKLENPCTKFNLVLDRYDEKGAICLDPADNFSKMYRVDTAGVKTELSNQEYLDHYNSFGTDSYGFNGSENAIFKMSGNDIPGYIEVPFDQIDTNKIYTLIEADGYGNYSYRHTDESGFVFDPTLKYYEEINLALPKSAEVKTDGSITYYTCDRIVQICREVNVNDIKKEDVLNYYVKNENPYKEEKVATIDQELFEKIKAPKAGLTAQNYNIYKLPNKDFYYVLYEEQTATTSTIKIYAQDGKLLFENVDTFGIINDELMYTIENNNIVIYNMDKEELKTISGSYFYKLLDTNNRAIFSVDDTFTTVYEIKKIETEIKEEVENKTESIEEKVEQIIDINNPDTGDTIISALLLGGMAIIGLILITKYKRNEN